MPQQQLETPPLCDNSLDGHNVRGVLPWPVVAHIYNLRSGEHIDHKEARVIHERALRKLRRTMQDPRDED